MKFSSSNSFSRVGAKNTLLHVCDTLASSPRLSSSLSFPLFTFFISSLSKKQPKFSIQPPFSSRRNSSCMWHPHIVSSSLHPSLSLFSLPSYLFSPDVHPYEKQIIGWRTRTHLLRSLGHLRSLQSMTRSGYVLNPFLLYSSILCKPYIIHEYNTLNFSALYLLQIFLHSWRALVVRKHHLLLSSVFWYLFIFYPIFFGIPHVLLFTVKHQVSLLPKTEFYTRQCQLSSFTFNLTAPSSPIS